MLLLALPYFSSPFGKDKQVNLLHLHPVVRPNAMPIRYSIVKEPRNRHVFTRSSLSTILTAYLEWLMESCELL